MSTSRLQHDEAGFLVGAPVDMRKSISLLETIRSDVHAMRQAIAGRASSVPRMETAKAPPVERTAAVPTRPSGLKGTGGGKLSQAEMAAAVNRQIAAMVKAAQPAARPAGRGKALAGNQGALPERGSNGRFLPKQQPDDPGSPGAPRSPRNPGDDADGLAKRIAAAVASGVSNSEEVDPTVKAFNEVAEPLKRGYTTLFGSRKDQKTPDRQRESWFRRIWGELRGFRSEQSAYDKAAVRSLKALENKPVGGPASGEGGLPTAPNIPSVPPVPLTSAFGRLASLFTRALPALGRLTLAAAPLLAIRKATEWAGDTEHDEERVEGIRKNLAEPAKALLKKGGIDKDADIEAIRTQHQREQNGTDEYERMDRAKAQLAASPKYSSQVEGLKPGSPEYDAKLKALAATPEFSSDLQVTYKGLEAQDVEAKKSRVTKAWEGVKAFGGKVGERWNDAKSYLLGASEKAGVDPGTLAKIANYESSFNPDAAPTTKDGKRLSSAHGYGQFLDSTWTDMINKYGAKYGVEGAGKLTKEQAAKYRGDKEIQAGMLAEFTRENIEKGKKYGGSDEDANVYAFHNLGDGDAKKLLTGMNAGMTVREALLQGVTSDKGRARVEDVITKNKDLYGDGNRTAAEAYQVMGNRMRKGEAFAADARAALSSGAPSGPLPNGAANEAAGGPSVPEPAMAKADIPASKGLGGMFSKGLESALAAVQVPAALGLDSAAMKLPQVVTASLPSIPSMPAPPSIPDAPQIQVPLSSGESRKSVTVVAPAQDVGQDLSNRRLAHIVTGGLSSLIGG